MYLVHTKKDPPKRQVLYLIDRHKIELVLDSYSYTSSAFERSHTTHNLGDFSRNGFLTGFIIINFQFF